MNRQSSSARLKDEESRKPSNLTLENVALLEQRLSKEGKGSQNGSVCALERLFSGYKSSAHSFSERFQEGDNKSENSGQSQFFFDVENGSADEEELCDRLETEILSIQRLGLSTPTSDDTTSKKLETLSVHSPRNTNLGIRNSAAYSVASSSAFEVEGFQNIIDHETQADFTLVAMTEDTSMEFIVVPHNSLRLELNDLNEVLEGLVMISKYATEHMDECVKWFFKWWDRFANYVLTFFKVEEMYFYPMLESHEKFVGKLSKRSRVAFRKEAVSMIEDIDLTRVKADGGFEVQLPYVTIYASKLSKSMVAYMKEKESIMAHVLKTEVTPAKCLEIEAKMLYDLQASCKGGLNLMIYVRSIKDSDRMAQWAKERLTMMQRLRLGSWEKCLVTMHLKFIEDIMNLVPDPPVFE